MDSAKAVIDPTHWFSRLLFWPHLGTLISVCGFGLLLFLLLRPFQDKKLSLELNELAGYSMHRAPMDGFKTPKVWLKPDTTRSFETGATQTT